MKSILLISFLFTYFQLTNQSSNNMYYQEIPSYVGKEFSSGNIAKRFVDGLGYRYYWASEGLTSSDLDYRPSEDASSMRETLEHVYGMSFNIMNAATNQPNARRNVQASELTYDELRNTTLENIQSTSAALENKSEEEISNLKIIYERNGGRTEIPFWNILNGQMSDMIYHTGQIVSFRRTNGNPLRSGVNVFSGTNPLSN